MKKIDTAIHAIIIALHCTGKQNKASNYGFFICMMIYSGSKTFGLACAKKTSYETTFSLNTRFG